MDFTAWVEGVKPWTDLVQLFGGLGMATIVLAYLRATVERRRWESFRRRIDRWLDQELKADRHPRELSNEEWMVECERGLFNFGFTPTQVDTLLATAVIVAKGRAAAKIFM